jgi:hypothetical protein
MRRSPLAVLVPLLAALALAACSTAASARRAQLRRGLDEVRVSRSPEEIWPEVQRFLYERGHPLVGDDRIAIGQKPQGAIGRALSRGHETRVERDGSRTLETDMDRSRLRVRAEARPLEGGGSRVRLTVLRELELNSMEFSEHRDEELELALLRRIDPAAAAVAAGEAPPPASAPAAPPPDPWAPVRQLLGAWVGALPGGGQVRWQFAFTEGGKFLEVRGSPLLFAGSTARSAAGEELGRISRDAAGARLVWNQFTYGGGVDRYQSVAPRADALVFESDSPESLPAGSRARLTLAPDPEGGLRATLEVAEPGKDLALAGDVRLKHGE